MQIRHKHTGSKGIFFVEEEGEVLAEMIYTIPGEGKMIIEHTEVGEALSGQGIGYQLVHEAVEYARHHGIRIIPLCPFANAVFKKKPEYADVLYTL